MLALVGSGEYLAPIEPLDRELINRLDQPVRVVCLPTAAGTEGDATINYWSQLGVEHFTRLGVHVEAVQVVDRASANNAEFAEIISRANFVYLSGGKPDYLYRSLQDTLTWRAISSVLEKGGLLAGCSAGAMILGEKIFGFPGWKPGFNLLTRSVIVPHYDEFPESIIRPARLLLGDGMTIVGIERNTALVKDSSGYEVLGSGGVTIWNKAHKMRYLQGPLSSDLFGE